MKKLVIFDLDGTLFNTAKGLMDSMNYALSFLGKKEITLDETKKYIGNGSLVFAERATQEKGEIAEKCHQLFLDDYNSKASEVTTVFPGIERVLKTLNNMSVKIAVLSNKPQKATEDICNNLLKDFKIDYFSGHKDNMPLKPDPSAVEEILSSLNIEREDAVLVGDGETDALTAQNADIDFIGVLWGNRTKKQLKENGAKTFAKTPDNLLNLLLNKYNKSKISKLFSEFKKFITKGNVLDMAVGVVVGAAFTAIVNSLVKDVITPFVSLITGGVSLTELKWVLKPAVMDGDKIIKPALTLNYGSFIQAIINFLLIAVTVFIILKVLVTIRKKLDYNQNMKDVIQEKLDTEQPLNKLETRWMKRMKKKDKSFLPVKKLPPAPVEPAKPPEPQLTDKLLMEILKEIKNSKSESQNYNNEN